ncbi:ribosomal protein S18-alanine N-acetyltransferase [Tianweitania sp. BSSL-BM11]|uniref:Ribosomal protein S18-alanine N-acetyltransferase n=1 Tax=Tianweitania aestuarii TaxID=2814886 RepID=A0ABS5RSJ4_9HYPH|nr:ribosomal protein S18-alanine N-acetyltransferase [Tianweitania aestuarii]MBS9719204.1 ribosomal protein S18-alanine N-acetyltransferase [Tianweitania aestuarii]
MRFPFMRRDHAILELEEQDCGAIAELHAEGFGRPWSTEEFESLLTQDTVFGFTAREIGNPRIGLLGFVLARLAADEGEILTVAVARSHRGQGLGRGLMDAVLRKLHGERAEELFLEVDETNAAAIALYKRLGFNEVARRPGYYEHEGRHRSDAIVMRRELRRAKPA